MATVVLVAGLLPYDSGKTWFTLGAALAAKEKGFKVSVFKPVAAHNLWYSPRTVKKSFELGLLVGNDLLRYYERGLVEDIGVSNPVAIATVPPDPGKYTSIEAYMEDFEDVGRVAVISRVYDSDRNTHVHYVHEENLSRTGEWARRLIRRMSMKFAAVPLSFASLTSFLRSSIAVENLDRCLRRLQRHSDVVFVESFSDALAPYVELLRSIDLLVIVAPSAVYVYKDVKALGEAAEEVVRRVGLKGYRSMYFLRLIRPDFSLETGLACKPSPKRAHREFVEKALARNPA